MKVIIGGVIPEKPVIETPQNLCGVSTLEDIITDGSIIAWYDSDAGGAALQMTEILGNGNTYYAARIVGECKSRELTAVVINITVDAPGAPDVDSPQTFCQGATLANISVPNNKIEWYAAERGGVALPEGIELTAGVTYYAAQKAGECSSVDRTAVLIEFDAAVKPVAPAIQTLCGDATLADITITGSNIIWYDENDAELLSTTPLVNGATYYAAQGLGICESSERVDVTVTLKNLPAPVALSLQAFCNSANATIDDLVADVELNSELKWYEDLLCQTLITRGTQLSNGKYFARAEDGECLSAVTEVEVTIVTTLSAPIAKSPQTFCEGALVSDLQANGVGIQWYDSETGNNPVTGALTEGIYYAKQSLGTCQSTEATKVNVIISDKAASISPVIATPQTLCAQAKLEDIQTDGNTNIVWYASADLTDNSRLDLNDILANGTYYASIAAGSCESETRTAVTINVVNSINVAAPVVKTPQNFCNGATLAQLSVPNNKILWYAADMGGNALNAGTMLTTGTYYAAQQAGSCESSGRTEVSVVVGTSSDAPVITPKEYCGGTVGDLEVTGSNVVWYDSNSPAGGNVLSLTKELENGKTYYAVQKSGSCQSAFAQITVNFNQPQAPVVVDEQSVECNGTIADLEPSGANVTWYSDDATTVVDPSYILTSGVYYVTEISGECQSEFSVPVTVTVESLEAPVAQDRQSINCAATIADLKVKGTNIVWYASAAVDAQQLPLTLELVDGNTYYASQTVNGCESARTPVTVSADILQIIQKDNHILVINNNIETNGGFNFTYYEWEKNGVQVKKGTWGEGKGGYYIEGDYYSNMLDPNARYIAFLTDGITGKVYETCPAEIFINASKPSISVYPNPLISSQMVYVDADMDESALETAYIEIYGPLGSYIGKVKAQRLTPVRLPEERGVYVLKFKSVEIEEFFKIIVK